MQGFKAKYLPGQKGNRKFKLCNEFANLKNVAKNIFKIAYNNGTPLKMSPGYSMRRHKIAETNKESHRPTARDAEILTGLFSKTQESP